MDGCLIWLAELHIPHSPLLLCRDGNLELFCSYIRDQDALSSLEKGLRKADIEGC